MYQIFGRDQYFYLCHKSQHKVPHLVLAFNVSISTLTPGILTSISRHGTMLRIDALLMPKVAVATDHNESTPDVALIRMTA